LEIAIGAQSLERNSGRLATQCQLIKLRRNHGAGRRRLSDASRE
jgi:hypothetical protein